MTQYLGVYCPILASAAARQLDQLLRLAEPTERVARLRVGRDQRWRAVAMSKTA